MSVQIHEPADQLQQLHVCLLPDFHLNLKTTTLLGSRAKLQGEHPSPPGSQDGIARLIELTHADIPKLEQLILTRLRAIIQDRLVHPNHLTLTLPRLQTSSSSKPIIADLGERAVEAVREGISKAASDFVNISPSDYLADTNQGANAGGSTSALPSPPASPPSLPQQLAPATAPAPATPSIRTKRIPMPAGFPGYSASAMDTPTPGGTGEYTQTRYRPNLPLNAQPQTPQGNARPVPAGRTSSMAPPSNTDSSSQFRFRGAFASQPPSESAGTRTGTGPGTGTQGMSVDQQRRLGVLNSRA